MTGGVQQRHVCTGRIAKRRAGAGDMIGWAGLNNGCRGSGSARGRCWRLSRKHGRGCRGVREPVCLGRNGSAVERGYVTQSWTVAFDGIVVGAALRT